MLVGITVEVTALCLKGLIGDDEVLPIIVFVITGVLKGNS